MKPLGAALTPTSVRLPIGVALLIACILAAATVRYRIRDVDASYRAGQTAYQERRFEDVVKLHREYVLDDKDSPKVATALLQLGTAYTELKRPELAIDAFERLRFDFPNVDYGAHSAFHLAKNYAAIGSTDRASEYARLLETTYGADSSWSKRLRKEHPALFPAAEPVAASVPSANGSGN